MAIVLNGTTGITTPDLTSAAGLDAADLTGTVASARLPAGSVLQVVQGTTSTAVSISGTTYTDSNLSATITPTSATSKILILVNQVVYQYATSTSQVLSGIRLLRDSTVIVNPYSDGTGPAEPYLEVGGGTEIYNIFRHTINYLDSPSTTSAISYKTQGALRNTGSGRTLLFQPSGSINATSIIILMEIAA